MDYHNKYMLLREQRGGEDIDKTLFNKIYANTEFADADKDKYYDLFNR